MWYAMIDWNRQTRRLLPGVFLLLLNLAVAGCGKPPADPAKTGGTPEANRNVAPPAEPRLVIDTGSKDGISSVSLDAAGNRMAILTLGGQEKPLQVWDIQKKEKIGAGEEKRGEVAISPDGKHFVDAFAIRDAKTGKQVHKLQGQEQVLYSPKGDLVVGCSFDKIERYDAATGKLLQQWTADPKSSQIRLAVAWDPVNRAVSAHEDGTVRIWDLKTGKLLNTLPYKESRPYSVAISPDGKRVACRFGYSPIVVWDVPTEKVVKTMQVGVGYPITFLPDNTTLVYADKKNGGIVLVNLDTDSRRILSGHGDKTINGLALTADGKTLASCADKDPNVKLWDVQAP